MASDAPRVICGDMRDVLATLPPEHVHAVVSDPPYGLAFMGKDWDQQVPGPDYWRAVLRVLKPGGHLVAFGGTRTAHRLACAIEDAGFELRDCLSWLYGSGFPKSHDVSKAIDREAGAVRCEGVPGPYASRRPRESAPAVSAYQDGVANAATATITTPATEAAREWDGWGTALKPAWEPIYLARKPFRGSVASNVCEHGCGALNIDGCRIGSGGQSKWATTRGGIWATDSDAKAALEASTLGRWPANLALDESAAAMLDAQTGELRNGGQNATSKRMSQGLCYGDYGEPIPTRYAGDSGGASRFFYTSKASRPEREAGLERFRPRNVNDGRDTSIDNPYQRGDTQRRNTHPTVKPVSLMRWLVRLITPPDGIVLDPFTGSGSTGVAAVLEGARFIGCELSPEFAELARARIAHAADEDDGPQLTLFERAELKPAPGPAQVSFLWTDDER